LQIESIADRTGAMRGKKGADPDIFLQIESIADLTGTMHICAPDASAR